MTSFSNWNCPWEVALKQGRKKPQKGQQPDELTLKSKRNFVKKVKFVIITSNLNAAELQR